MASLTKDKRTGLWIARIKNADGNWTSRSTQSRNRGEANRFAVALEAEEVRRRAGESPTLSVADVCLAYVEHLRRQDKASVDTVETAVRLHIVPVLGPRRLDELRRGEVIKHLQDLEPTLGPASRNRVRATLHAAIELARHEERFAGDNVVAKVKQARLPHTLVDTLRREEVARLLSAVQDPTMRALCAVAIFTGGRKGEVVALRKEDVHLDAGYLTFAGSHERRTTKNGTVRSAPIIDALRPYLEAALANQPENPLLFPHGNGQMLPRHTDVAAVVKRALKRAGLVLGYDHKCRRCHTAERHADADKRHCAACGMTLWPSAVPREITYHRLRHTAASLMREAGIDAFAVMRILGHSSEKMLEHYSHADAHVLVRSAAPFNAMISAVIADDRCYGVVTDANSPQPVDDGTKKTPDLSGAFMVELDGIEPTTSSLQSSRSPN